MVKFFTNFKSKRNPNGWVTHGMMHACHVGDTWHVSFMPCGFVQSIKTGSVEEKEKKQMRRKEERKKGRKEDLTASSSESWHSNGRSSSSQELKLATLQEVRIFSYFG